MSKGKLFVISGPSGTGKGTICKELLSRSDSMRLSISMTTRGPREGEVHGVHYLFMTKEEFNKMAENNDFLEHAEFAGNYYGTPLPPIIEKTSNGISVILEIEVKGFKQVKEKMPEAISVFLAPPSMEELERRLRNRGTDSEEKILERLSIAKEEMKLSEKYDYIVVNDDVDRAVREIINIIEMNRSEVL